MAIKPKTSLNNKKDDAVVNGIFLTIYGAIWFLLQAYRPLTASYMLPLLVFMIGLKMLFFD